MIVNMNVFKDKGYRTFYSTELGKYFMACTKISEKVEETFFEITSCEYDEWSYNPVHLNWFAECFSLYGKYCSRICSTETTKILKAELKEYEKKRKNDRIRIIRNSGIISSEEQLVRNDFRTLCLIAKVNALAQKFKSGAVPFSKLKNFNETRLIYDDEDIIFNDGNISFCRIIEDMSMDAFGDIWIESFYDDSVFNGMNCFLVVNNNGNGEKYITIAVQNESDEIEINENGEWYVVHKL